MIALIAHAWPLLAMPFVGLAYAWAAARLLSPHDALAALVGVGAAGACAVVVAAAALVALGPIPEVLAVLALPATLPGVAVAGHAVAGRWFHRHVLDRRRSPR